MDVHPDRTSREIRGSRVSRRPPRLSATLMTLGIVCALAYVFFLRTPPPPATPDVGNVRGTYVRQTEGQATSGALRETGAFSAVASGDAAGTLRSSPVPTRRDAPGPVRSFYDAQLLATLTTTTFGDRVVTSRTVGAWPPVWRTATPSPLDYQGLPAIVRAALEDGDRGIGVKPLKEGDRTVWRAAMTLNGADVEVVVDQLSGLVLWYVDGRSTFTATVDWDSTAAAGAADAVGAAGGTRETATEARAATSFTYAPTPAAAGRTAGYAPLVSDLAPDGFALKAVATANAGGAPRAWLVRDRRGLPVAPLAGQRQVAQLYTRGLSWFTVQQLGPEAAGASVALLRDTLRSTAVEKLSLKTATLQFGTLRGATAYTWFDVTGPTLLVSDARYIVYMTGALTRRELVAFAEGLRPVGSGGAAAPSPSPSPSASP